MDNLFSDCPCEIIVDDLLIWGATEEEHDQNLLRVLQKACEVNLKLKMKKFKFKEAEVSYVGHLLTKDGLNQTPTKCVLSRRCHNQMVPRHFNDFLAW